MKTTILLVAGFLVTGFMACNDAESRYIDLSTGENVELREDEKTGLMVNAETGEPVRIYVDTRSKDTIWGTSGKVINGYVYKDAAGGWEYRGEDYKQKSGDDSKVKGDGDEYKIKNGDYKKEVEKDGDITIKNGDTKIKIDGETGERKVKKD